MANSVNQVTIVKDWAWPDLRRQTPNGDGIWDNIRFSVDSTEPCDALVVLNNRLSQSFSTTVLGKNVWALMQEPYVKGVNDWMAEKHDAFDKVFSHFLPKQDDRYIRSNPAIPWHVNFTYNELVNMPMVKKSRQISWIVGNVKDLPGHIKRWRFLQALRQEPSFEIDLFGKAVRFIEFKNEGLLPYRYSLAVENTYTQDYWTEKIADCLLTWTVPIYYGCPNLEDYFPPKAFIRIDIEKPAHAMAHIREVLANDDWDDRLQALSEARDLILHKYQFFPHLCAMIKKYADAQPHIRQVTIPAYRRSPKAYLYRRLYKVKKAFGLI